MHDPINLYTRNKCARNLSEFRKIDNVSCDAYMFFYKYIYRIDHLVGIYTNKFIIYNRHIASSALTYIR